MFTPEETGEPADDGLDIKEAIENWRRHLRQKSASTVKVYVRSAEKLACWLENHEMPTRVRSIGPRELQLFFILLDGAESSRSQVYRSLQQFFRFLAEREAIPASPLAAVEAPSQKLTPVSVVASDDLRRLVRHARDGNTFGDRRDYAILRLLIDTGMRIGELTGLELADIDLAGRALTVRGRNGERTLVMEQPTFEALRQYIRARSRHRAAERSALWLAGKGSRTGVLTQWGIRQAVERRVEQAGLSGRIYPLKFRHTYAHRWLVNGGQAHDLMLNAGWRSPALISRYGTSAAAERARAASLRASLADQI